MSREMKIKRLSKFLHLATLSVLCLLPIWRAGYWITDGYPFLVFFGFDVGTIAQLGSAASIPPLTEMKAHIKFLGFLVDLIPTVITMISLGFLAKLFKLYEQLSIFSEKSVQCIRNAGYALLLNQLIHPLYIGFITFTLTFSNPPGQRNITLILGSEEVKFIGIALFIILISWILEIGCALQEEQANTI